MELLTQSAPVLTAEDFRAIAGLVKSRAGIDLHAGKTELIKSRLNKRLRALELDSYRAYLDYLAADRGGVEFSAMLDALATNVTRFFRETNHFEYLAESILPERARSLQGAGRRLRIWSAGCSSGEEPYSIAMVLDETLPDLASWDAKILATDLSTRVLQMAREGSYRRKDLTNLAPERLRRHFGPSPADSEMLQVREPLRKLVTFGRLNLLERWPMRGPFDVIFCCNVMIYFDSPTQATLVRRFGELLRPGGVLMIGHSESLASIKHGYTALEPSIYRK